MSEDQITNSSEVKEFIDNFADKSSSELSSIITRYIGYKPEAVEAALYISVEKGFISYDLKESLWRQIQSAYRKLDNIIKYYGWESDNAFVKYFSGYDDEKIYSIIEDPGDIVIDVFHALLVTAKERELISDIDFNRYYNDAKLALRSNEEIDSSIIADIFGMKDNLNETPVSEIIEDEREKYWKCPNCKENVGMEYAVCWNCQASIPEKIEHPDNLEIAKEMPLKVPATPFSIGIKLIIAGVVVVLLDMLRTYRYSSHFFSHLGGYILGGFLVVLGIAFIVYGTISKHEPD